jgi:hypothetical protein
MCPAGRPDSKTFIPTLFVGFDGIIDPFCAVVNGFFEKSGIEILFTLLYNRLKTQSITNKGSTLL